MGNKIVNTSLIFVMTSVILVSAYVYFKLNALEAQLAASARLAAVNGTLVNDTRSRLGEEYDWFTPTPTATATPDPNA